MNKLENIKDIGSKLIKGEKFMYTHENIITPTVMYSEVSTPVGIEFRSKLGLNLYDRPLSKEQSII